MAHTLNYLDLDPAERLLAALVKQALWDATQQARPQLQAEAWHWLWMVAPSIAARADLPQASERYIAMDTATIILIGALAVCIFMFGAVFGLFWGNRK